MKLYSCDVDDKTGRYIVQTHDVISQDDRYTKFLTSEGYTVNFETEGLQYRGLFFSPREAVASMIWSFVDSIKACERTIDESRRRIRELRDLDTNILFVKPSINDNEKMLQQFKDKNFITNVERSET